MFPAVVMLESEIDLHEWPPLWPLRLSDQMHAGLDGSSIGLVGVAGNAGANDILPGGWSSSVARDDVVQIQILAVELIAAILAGILVPFKDVVPCEFDFLLWKAIEEHQKNYPGHADAKGDRMDAFGMGFLLRKVVPFMEIERLEGPIAVVHDHLGTTFKKERQGPFG